MCVTVCVCVCVCTCVCVNVQLFVCTIQIIQYGHFMLIAVFALHSKVMGELTVSIIHTLLFVIIFYLCYYKLNI